MSIVVKETCINDELVPKHTHVCVCQLIFIADFYLIVSLFPPQIFISLFGLLLPENKLCLLRPKFKYSWGTEELFCFKRLLLIKTNFQDFVFYVSSNIDSHCLEIRNYLCQIFLNICLPLFSIYLSVFWSPILYTCRK